MNGVIEKDKALDYVSRRYGLLSRTGYTKHTMTKWYLYYLFIIDFYEWLFPYFTNDDFKAIEYSFVKLFSGGNCLVRYQSLNSDELKVASHVGAAHYVGPTVMRSVAHEDAMRNTEDNRFRRIE